MFDEDPLYEMANLTVADTSVPGIIQILSEAKPRPRVRWFPSAPQSRTEPCLTVSLSSTISPRNLKLPPAITQDASPMVVAWVELNKLELLTFWYLGYSWEWRDVNAFIDGLRKIS